VIVTAPKLRVIASADRDHHRLGASRFVASAAVDAVAAGILLLGTPFAPGLDALAAAVSHATAVLLLSGLARARPGRRCLCVAAVLAVPCAGVAVAAATWVTRGRGSAARERRRRKRRRPALTRTALRRLGDALSPCDALLCGDEEQRRAALSTLLRRGDPEAMGLLRRTAAGHDPELALSAALVLDEIGERAERQASRLEIAEVRDEAG
jgi:hypothetical protein